MIIKDLYRIKREDGGVTVSTVQPECEYEITHRLIADEGNVLTDNVNYYPCIDTDTPELFTEIEDTMPSLLEI